MEPNQHYKPQSFSLSSVSQWFLKDEPSEAETSKSQDCNPAVTLSQSISSPHSPLLYHIYTIWLFTLSDLKTIVFPSTAFGILTALSSSVFGTTSLPPLLVLERLPAVLFWTWLNLLPFCIGNQRQAGAAIEDKQNKPWRPIPSGRLTPKRALKLQLAVHPIAYLVSTFLGGTPECLVLVALEYWYNDLDGGGRSCIMRNIVNASGFTVYSSGSLAVAYKGSLRSSAALYNWQLLMGAVVASTGHSQDMADQTGDQLRNRKTVPLVVGDGIARWTIAVPMVFWVVFIPRFLGLGAVGHLITFAIGGTVIVRTLIIRDIDGDKTTFQFWNLWMVVLYLLPLIKAYTPL